jgi:hypothetical protein
VAEGAGVRHRGATPVPAVGIVFFRTLSPSVTHAQVEALCRAHPGLLLVEMGQPRPAHAFHRMAYAYYAPGTDVAAIANALDNSKVRGPSLLCTRSGTGVQHVGCTRTGTLAHMNTATQTEAHPAT